MADCLIGLGSNLGERSAQIDRAIRHITDHHNITLVGRSRFLETPAVGGPAGQGAFLNAVIRTQVDMTSSELLQQLQKIEQSLGRQRLERWGPRTVDIDLLLYDQAIIDKPGLQVPHPRMATRRFVLLPACDVGPEMIHAPTGWTLEKLLARLNETPCYAAIACLDLKKATEVAQAVASKSDVDLLIYDDHLTSSDEIQFQDNMQLPNAALVNQVQLLSTTQHSIRPQPHAQPRIYLSNFWLPTLLAFANTGPTSNHNEQFSRACQSALERTPLPQLILHLDTTIDGPPSATTSLARQLRRQTQLPGQGPVLRAATTALSTAITELSAGIDAMRPIAENWICE